MGGTILATASSTRPLLPPSLSLSLPDPSTEHRHKHSHTHTAGDFTAADCVTPGDLILFYHTLIFTYLSFALFKYCGEMLQTQVQALEA